MKIRFLAPAQREVDDAVAWYREQFDHLGQEFLDQLDRAVRRVVAFPLSCQEMGAGLRRCLLARFPYGLIYGLEDSTLIIVAVAHLHRKPNYWSDRAV